MPTMQRLGPSGTQYTGFHVPCSACHGSCTITTDSGERDCHLCSKDSPVAISPKGIVIPLWLLGLVLLPILTYICTTAHIMVEVRTELQRMTEQQQRLQHKMQITDAHIETRLDRLEHRP